MDTPQTETINLNHPQPRRVRAPLAHLSLSPRANAEPSGIWAPDEAGIGRRNREKPSSPRRGDDPYGVDGRRTIRC